MRQAQGSHRDIQRMVGFAGRGMSAAPKYSRKANANSFICLDADTCRDVTNDSCQGAMPNAIEADGAADVRKHGWELRVVCARQVGRRAVVALPVALPERGLAARHGDQKSLGAEALGQSFNSDDRIRKNAQNT